MNGTYFFQNEVFEDEAAGEVEVDGADLGAERMVYLGRSVEGVLRHRKVEELARIFRDAFVCIRRYRTTGRRLRRNMANR